MSSIIHIAAESEPLELHGHPTATEVFGVQIALEVSGIGETPAGEAFKAFLSDLPMGKFFLFAIDNANTVHNQGELVREVPIGPSDGSIFNWLEDSKKAYQTLDGNIKSLKSRLAEAETESPLDSEVAFYDTSSRGVADMRNATATDLLRATGKWPAPLAQDAGLVVPLVSELERKVGAKHVVVFLAEGLNPDTLTFTATVDTDANLAELIVSDAGAELFKIQTGLVEEYTPIGTLFENTGKFVTLDQNEELARLTSRIEELAPSLMNVSAIINDIALNEAYIRYLAGIPDEQKIPVDTELDEADLFGLMRCSIVTLLDIPLISLNLPKPKDDDDKNTPAQQKSSVLALLSRGIASRFELEDPIQDIDETILYRLLHKKISEELNNLGTPVDDKFENLWESFKPVIKDNERLGLLEDALSKPTPANSIKWGDWRERATEFTAQLGEFSVLLEGEGGFEAWLLGVFDNAFLENSVFNVDLTDAGISDNEENRNQITQVYSAFRSEVTGNASATASSRGNFNAAEAVRRDFGTLILAVLSESVPFEIPADLSTAINSADWFKRRIFGPTGTGFALDGILEPCIAQSQITETKIAKILEQVFAARAKEILEETEALQLFRPDPSPKQLPIRIVERINPSFIDEVNARVSGLGFIVRSEKADGTNRKDLHANLVAVHDRKDINSVKLDPTVLPVIPVMTPGSAGLYVLYDGVPLASPNRPKPGKNGAELDPVQFYQAEAEKAVRGYQILESANAPSLPALAYGRKYAISSFWVPPSGVLPVGVRAADDKLFEPGAPIDEFKAPDSALHPYLRRTAIGDIEIDVNTEIPADIHPLVNDDPRLVLESFSDGARKIDINKRADGTGGLLVSDLELVENTPVARLNSASFSGGLGPEHVSVLAQNSSIGEVGTGTCELDGDTLVIKFEFTESDKPFWLEISWKDGAPPSGCLSFDDPSHEKQQDNAGRSGPIVLLAPDQKGWKQPSSKSIIMRSPKVSFPDFECWARNATLWEEIAGIGSEKLREALLWAKAMFEETGDAYAEKMNKLPDPAVQKIVCFAAASDEIRGERSTAKSANQTFEIKPYLASGLAIPELNLGTDGIADPTEEQKEEAFERKRNEFRDLVDEILKRSEIELKLQISAPDSDVLIEENGLTQIPEGWVIRLAAQPGVPKKYLGVYQEGVVFHEDMQQLAKGSIDDLTLFDGPVLHIEGMTALPDDQEIPSEVLQAKTQGQERAYTLVYQPELQHRIFSSAQLILQQWRPTGRPIYRWIDPVPAGMIATKPVIDLTPKDSRAKSLDVGDIPVAELIAFEADAFFGIGRDDADRKPVIRLQPAPAATQLSTQDWPERSAAYFRHRLILRSRYYGAMSSSLKSVENISEVGEAGWATRVAILADPLAAELSRPQLRTYFPVQQTIQEGTNSPIAPVACVLSEPPFQQLGLAERLEAELKTINTYEIGADANSILRVDKLRKEIGPDPRLSYFPIDDDTSRSVTISAEGPVGLHFDADDIEAPAFSNSQFMLHINVENSGDANPEELEESFAGVSLTRYADPTWSYIRGVQRETSSVNILPKFGDSWIDLTDNLKIKDDELTIIEITKNVDDFSIGILGEVLFAQGGNAFKELCKVSGSKARISILLRSVKDGRHQLCVFRKPLDHNAAGVTSEGRIDRPQLVASAFFSASGRIGFDSEINVQTTRQSEATFVEWVRTARDMSHIMKHGDSEERIQLSTLTPTMPTSGTGRLKFVTSDNKDCRISSPVSMRRYPLHVHRHLVFMIQKPSRQIGHQIDLFDKAVVADGWGQADLQASPGSSVSIAEMETRAEIVRVTPSTANGAELERYDAAHFDLASSHFDPRHHGFNDESDEARSNKASRDIQQMRLHFRPIENRIDLKDLKFVLSVLDKEGNIITELELDPAIGSSTIVNSFNLYLFKRPPDEDGNAQNPSWSMKLPDKDEEMQGEEERLLEFFKAEAYELKIINSAGPSSEIWLDVSLLHSSKIRGSIKHPLPDGLDFDWIFGPVRNNEVLPDALAPDRLNRLTEVQGRIIGLSKPIEIKFR